MSKHDDWTATLGLLHELGWDGREAEGSGVPVLDLPLGTAEQQRAALAALSRPGWQRWLREQVEQGELEAAKGDRGGIEELRGTQARRRGRLGLFATRLGAPAKQVAWALEHASNDDLLDVVAQRGQDFASGVVRELYNGDRGDGGWAGPVAEIAATLVARMGLEIPTERAYLRDVMGLCSVAFDRSSELQRQLVVMSFDFSPVAVHDPTLLEARFAEHARAARDAGVSGLGAFPSALAAGLERGLIERSAALDLAVEGLEAATKPRERKVWVLFLRERAEASGEELAARVDVLVPVLSLGDGVVNAELGPSLLAAASIRDLPDIAVAILNSGTAKAKKLGLKALAGRPPVDPDGGPLSAEFVAEFGELAAGLVQGGDAGLASAARRWAKAWGLPLPTADPTPAPTPDPTPDAAEGAVDEVSGAPSETGAQPWADDDFEAAWLSGRSDPASIPDGTAISTALGDRVLSIKTKDLVFRLRLAGDERDYFVSGHVGAGPLAAGLIRALARERDAQTPGEMDRHGEAWLALDQATGTLRAFGSSAEALAAAAAHVDDRFSESMAILALGSLGWESDHRASASRALESLFSADALGPRRVDAAMAILLGLDLPKAERIFSGLDAVARSFLSLWWPALTQAVSTGAELTEAPPRWLNAALTVASDHAAVLREAGRRGLLPDPWPRLAELALRPGKAAALVKARALAEALR